MKPVILLISGLAFFSFTQSMYAVTLDSKEVTIIIEGDQEQGFSDSSNRITKQGTIPIVLENNAVTTLLTTNQFNNYPFLTVFNSQKETSHERITTDAQKKIATVTQSEVDTTVQTIPTEKQIKNHTLFPSDSIVILNQEDDLLPDYNLAKHSYLGNLMGATSQSINR